MITITSTSRINNTTVVNVTSSLTAPVWYFWYLDGVFVSTTRAPKYTFVLPAGQQSQVDVLDGNTSTPPAAPTAYPAVRVINFVRSLGGVDRYRIEQQANGGAWIAIGYVQDNPRSWSYQITTPRLDDLTQYAWRVIPIDAAGNDGTALSLGQELIVRTPDAPNFTVVFDAVHDQVMFSAP
jgi:hypothetical protein